ncbi:hypothetical protein H257_18328 [Aphanomyces astaci]|uniref:Uncharacterized protein n=1 Tax=Aphanomyces astaci TaxID=112090 RepID=W4FBI3_APHAT|nr:hypothetical protein H257_18328 [Aphanomyces astaci]ETV64847.1 hypothetical protein H257_18328 [Aphanomyces astaci]|eukprot:XP_009845666.1 hypothetical protein H257_18328 [Aphanomyces astaci]
MDPQRRLQPLERKPHSLRRSWLCLGKVGGLQTRLREDQDEAKKYKELSTRVENAIQAQLSSMADQQPTSRALATVTLRFPDVVPAFWDWVSAHFRVTSGPVFDLLLEACVRDDPARFEGNCENISGIRLPDTTTPVHTHTGPNLREPGCPNPFDPDLAIRSGAIPGVSRANQQDDFGHGCVVRGRRCFGLKKIGLVYDPRDYRYGIRGRGFEPRLNVGASERASGAVQTTRTSGKTSPGPGGPRAVSQQIFQVPRCRLRLRNVPPRYVDAVDEKGPTFRP